MIIPRLKRDQESHILSLTLSRSPSQESEFYGKLLLEHDQRGELVRVSILPFSLEEFGEAKRTRSAPAVSPSVASAVS